MPALAIQLPTCTKSFQYVSVAWAPTQIFCAMLYNVIHTMSYMQTWHALPFFANTKFSMNGLSSKSKERQLIQQYVAPPCNSIKGCLIHCNRRVSPGPKVPSSIVHHNAMYSTKQNRHTFRSYLYMSPVRLPVCVQPTSVLKPYTHLEIFQVSSSHVHYY